MKSTRNKSLFMVSVLLIALLLMAVYCAVIFTDYNWLVNRIVTGLHRPGLESLIHQKSLTARKYRFIQYLCGAGLLLVPALAATVLRRADKAIAVISMVTSSVLNGFRLVGQVYQQNTAAQNASLALTLLFVFVKCLYYIQTWDLQYDEMWCYNYLTARPFYFTFFAYNNYPLYELTTHVFKMLPFAAKINLRLPVLLTGMLSCGLLYACLRKYCRSHAAALGGLLVYAFMPVTTLYMLYARGVIYESFFAIAAIFSLYWWAQTGNKKWMVFFSLANALGMYAMPTHLYMWVLLFVLGAIMCLRQRKSLVAPFLLANGFAVVLCFLLYLPVLLGSGISFVVGAAAPRYTYIQIIPNIPAFVAYYSGYFTGFRVGIVCIAGIATGFLLQRKARYEVFALSLVLALCFLPLLAYVMLRMVVPWRALGFVALAMPLFFAITLQRLEKGKGHRMLYPFIILIAGVLVVVSHRCYDLNWSRPRDREAIRLSDLFMNRGVRNMYDSSAGSEFFYFYPALQYYYEMHHKQINFWVVASNSIRFRPFRLDDGYDCIVYRADRSGNFLPAGYKEVYSNRELNYKVLIKD